MTWNPGSWRPKPARHQPVWPDEAGLEEVQKQLSLLPPLVFAGEARRLRQEIAEVAEGKAFILQAGDCAESFTDFNADSIRNKLQVILQMAVVLTYSSGVPIVKLGRIAGQFAKPRSSPTEVKDGVELPSFLGHMVNDAAFSEPSRVPDAQRLLQVYHQSASTLNLLRAFTQGGFARLRRVHDWTQEFVANSPEGKRYEQLATEIERALRFMEAAGISSSRSEFNRTDFYTSHEGLILEYEQALTRQDSVTGNWYDCSAHLIWIGERTRSVDEAHAEFLSGVHNPIACKVGPTATKEELLPLLEKLDPNRDPGRLTLITRMGASKITDVLPGIIEDVRDSGHPVAWISDPMHGNTFTSETQHKTRRFDEVMTEVTGFFDVHHSLGTWPGGVHVELTGEDVTECLGGTNPVHAGDLPKRYETICDPRLNGQQSLDLAFEVAELMRSAPNTP